jgi:hypothetical protein
MIIYNQQNKINNFMKKRTLFPNLRSNTSSPSGITLFPKEQFSICVTYVGKFSKENIVSVQRYQSRPAVRIR